MHIHSLDLIDHRFDRQMNKLVMLLPDQQTRFPRHRGVDRMTSHLITEETVVTHRWNTADGIAGINVLE